MNSCSMKSVSFLITCLLPLLLSACEAAAPGSVALGESCQYDIDCAPVDGGIASCMCISGHTDSPRCQASFLGPVFFHCGSDDGPICDEKHTCRAGTDPLGECLPNADRGQSCAELLCLPGLFCNGVCENPRGAGEDCDPRDQKSCAAPLFCSPSTSKCTAPGQLGQPCSNADEFATEGEAVVCVTGLVCSPMSGTCVAPRPNGGVCQVFSECLSRKCSFGRCIARICH
jgi:hypothetical protein